jgi:hypothetical protein
MHPMAYPVHIPIGYRHMTCSDGHRYERKNVPICQKRSVQIDLKTAFTQWGWWAVGFAVGLLGYLLYLRFSPS